MRLRFLPALERWELSVSIANVLPNTDTKVEKCRETCARFHHGFARALSLAGYVGGSRRQIRAAVEAWPEIRLELVDDREVLTCSNARSLFR